MAKCELTETEVLEAEKNFIAANPSGVIFKEEFVLSMKVTLDTSKLSQQTTQFTRHFNPFEKT